MTTRPVGVLLAGGLARRMGGGDKPLRMLAGRPILDHVIERLRPQCDGLLLNANGDPARFSAYGLMVIADTVPDYAGPLAGVLAAMEYCAEHRPDVSDIVSVATDTPFLPHDLVDRLIEARTKAKTALSCAQSGEQTHPPFGLWPVALRHDLRTAMLDEGLRKIDLWTARYGIATAIWPDQPYDPFFNANRPDDLQEAEAIAATLTI
jgi:molybdopterin-guanine dinucleotide biosynthesis protein A